MSANRIASGSTSERLRSAATSLLLCGSGEDRELATLRFRESRDCVQIARDDRDARARLTRDAIELRVLAPSRRQPSFWHLRAPHSRARLTVANATNTWRIP